jgi:hypothetical protein
LAAAVDNAAVASGSAVAVGKTVSITTTPSGGYQLSALSYNDGTNHDITSTKSFTMPAHAVTVTATFSALPTHTLTLKAPGTGYSIKATVGGVDIATSTTDNVSVNVAEDAVVTISAPTIASGHTFSSWTVSNAEVSGNTNPATFTMGTLDVTVEATFAQSAKKTYTLTLSASDIDVTDSNVPSGYARFNGSHSKNAVASDNSTFEVVFTTSQVMPNSGDIQFQASNGKLYNTVDLGTITNVSAGNDDLTVIIGSSENPTTASTTNKGYFVIKKTNKGAASTSTITITFEK